MNRSKSISTKPRKNNPTFSNIYLGEEHNNEFFQDIPFYTQYLLSICNLFEFPRKHILDIGCGRGEYGDEIKKHWGKSVESYLGIDLDEQLVKSLSKKHIRSGDLLSFKSRRKYDIVLCHSVLQYIADPDTAFRKLRSLVKKTGFVSVFQTMTSEDYALYKKQVGWEDPYAWQHSVEDLRKSMSKYFDILSYGILVPKGAWTKEPYTVDKLFLLNANS